MPKNRFSWGWFFCWLIVGSPSGHSRGFGDATYNPATGRMTIQVEDANAWGILSPQGLLTGPDRAADLLPITLGGLVTINAGVISEANFHQFTYGPVDLGRVAQTNIPMGELYLICDCPFSDGTKRFPVRYIPEPATLAFGWLAATLGARRPLRQRRVVM